MGCGPGAALPHQCCANYRGRSLLAGVAEHRGRPTEALPQKSFVSLRGLPSSTITLTKGQLAGPGLWVVPFASLPDLKAQIPAGLAGQSDLTVSLIAMNGRLLAEARTKLVIETTAMQAERRSANSLPRTEAAAPRAREPAPVDAPGAAPPPHAPVLQGAERARAENFLAHGEAYLANRNVLGARELLSERQTQAFRQRPCAWVQPTIPPSCSGLTRMAWCRTWPLRASGTSAPASWVRRRLRSGWHGSTETRPVVLSSNDRVVSKDIDEAGRVVAAAALASWRVPNAVCHASRTYHRDHGPLGVKNGGKNIAMTIDEDVAAAEAYFRRQRRVHPLTALAVAIVAAFVHSLASFSFRVSSCSKNRIGARSTPRRNST